MNFAVMPTTQWDRELITAGRVRGFVQSADDGRPQGADRKQGMAAWRHI
jgi:hypothetical protein